MPDGMKPGERHLSAESFDRCLLSRVPVEHPIKGIPPLTLFIDPARHEIGLSIPATVNEGTASSGRENVKVRTTHRSGARHFEIVIDDQKLFIGAYPLLCGVADQIQVEGLSVQEALTSTIRLFDSLLRRDPTLTVEREIGLLGELLILRTLCDEVGVADAVSSWRGPASEEHDFSVYDVNLEIKTTSAERRTHWIGSLTQLVPTASRPLWLISHQLTRGGPRNGQSLRELIEDLRYTIGDGQQRESFERRLLAAGWTTGYEQTAGDPWLRRGRSLAFTVDRSFPRLTPSILSAAGASLNDILDVRYRIDLTDLPAATHMPKLIAALQTDGDTHD